MDTNRSRSLLKLIQAGDISKLRTFIADQYEDDSWKYEKHVKSGDNLLHLATRSGHLDLVKWLVKDHSLRLSVTNNDAKQPLHDAAHFSHIRCLQFLLDNGASVDCLKKSDW